MNFAHLHLLLNHFPIIGTMIGCALFLISFFGKNEDMRRASYILLATMALLTIPAFLSGFGAQIMIGRQPGVSDALIQRHEGSAMLALWFMEATGAFALVGLWQSHRSSRPTRWNIGTVFVLSILTMGLMARTGNTGGDIRHPEVNPGQAKVTEGTVGSMMQAFEPNPTKFSLAMVDSKYWWAFMMTLHFIGLILIVGTVGLFDIRILGFAKHLPIAPIHKFMPWAMAGLGVNVVTGMLAFIGESTNYVDDAAFWLKMLALMLLGLNVAAFYLTGIFDRVEHLGPGEDAPMSAKLIAVSSMVLWIAVITLGRYIQIFLDTIPLSGTQASIR
jgi:uncharacterized membrane protein